MLFAKQRTTYTSGYHSTLKSKTGLGRPSSIPVMSSISNLTLKVTPPNYYDFKITCPCSDTCELLIHENLLISKLKPMLVPQSINNRKLIYRLHNG